jgi:hypothetical protein
MTFLVSYYHSISLNDKDTCKIQYVSCIEHRGLNLTVMKNKCFGMIHKHLSPK